MVQSPMKNCARPEYVSAKKRPSHNGSACDTYGTLGGLRVEDHFRPALIAAVEVFVGGRGFG
jgi:hypothetical protein